jgi:hypothetical protein
MWAPNRNLRGLSLPYAGEALVIKALNVVAIEAFVTDLHPGAERAHGGKLLDGNNPFHNATHWEGDGYGQKRDEEDARDMVWEIASREFWIMEGVYGWLADMDG